MINETIKRYCEISYALTELYRQLDKARYNHDDGGFTFEDCNQPLISEINELENEFLVTFKQLMSCSIL